MASVQVDRTVLCEWVAGRGRVLVGVQGLTGERSGGQP